MTVDTLWPPTRCSRTARWCVRRPKSHPDLFWALRGGGGNFVWSPRSPSGATRSGTPARSSAGPVLYDIADTREVMQWYRELLPSLPEELSGWIGLHHDPACPAVPRGALGPQGVRRSCGATPATPHGRSAVTAPVREFGAAAAGRDARRCRSTCCSRRSTGSTRPGCSGTGAPTSAARSPTRRSPCTRSTARCCRPGTRPCTCTRSTVRRPGVPGDATAYAWREGGWAAVIVGVDPDPANAEAISRWARDYFDELHPTSAGGHVRQLPDGRGPGAGPGSLRRQLRTAGRGQAALRPGRTLFRVNQNIQPAS